MAKRGTLFSIGLLLILIGVGVTDALLTDFRIFGEVETAPSEKPAENTPQTIEFNPSKPVSITQGPNVLEALVARKYTFADVKNESLLEMIITDETPVHAYTLLHDGDRAGLLAWTESSRVKVYFLSLKEALHTSFSANVSDLIDETKNEPGKPTYNLLTFFDPAISEERLVFVRSRERLYELHIAEGNDDLMFELVEELTR